MKKKQDDFNVPSEDVNSDHLDNQREVFASIRLYCILKEFSGFILITLIKQCI